MQSAIFEPTNLPEIETSGAIANAVFVDPVLAMAGVVLVGALVFLALRSRGLVWKGFVAFCIALVLAGGLFVTSRVVVTDREALSERARELVAGVAGGDEVLMRRLLGAQVRVQTRFGGAQGVEGVVSLVGSRVPGLVVSHRVPEVRADLPGPRVGRTMIKVRIEGSMVPSSSWWMVHWMRDDETTAQWRATLIEPVWIQGVSNPGG